MTPSRIAFIAILAVSLVPSVEAAESKSNTLTPEEIQEGWILLFDGATAFGWKVDGEAKVEEGVLRIGGSKRTTITTTTSFPASELRFEFRSKGKIDLMSLGLPLTLSDQDTGRQWNQLKFEMKGHSFAKGDKLKKEEDASRSNALELSCEIELGKAKISTGKKVRTETTYLPIQIQSPENGFAELRSIKIRPNNLRSLFNGRDLEGWSVFEDAKRNKSKWSVTKEGWLNVKNGPGDLQSAGKYADFILQLECISNGKGLNSGVFFRCIDKEYQYGYEMQIQNGYWGEDRTKPSDFGTGAIYRRVPARKVVPNDNEWFSMTLAVQGKHIATWVNGYQTVDWTDDRKDDSNPRKGAKTGAGHLSIQGHDPTTDLSFRKLRLVEFTDPAKAER